MGGWWFADGCSAKSHLNGNRSYEWKQDTDDDPFARFKVGYYDADDLLAGFRVGTQGIIWTELTYVCNVYLFETISKSSSIPSCILSLKIVLNKSLDFLLFL